MKFIQLSFFSLFFGVSFLEASELTDAKCGTTQKDALLQALRAEKAAAQAQKNMAKVQAISSCEGSLGSAYASCLNAVNSGLATGGGASAAKQAGTQQFSDQGNLANTTSALSKQDQAANEVCVQRYTTASSTCNGFSTAAQAQSYANLIRGKCLYDASLAKQNTDNMDQLSKADEDLAGAQPQMPQSSPAASPAPLAQTPSMPQDPSGYTPSDYSTSSSPNFDFPSPNIPDPSGYAANAGVPSNNSNQSQGNPVLTTGTGVAQGSLTDTSASSSDNFSGPQESSLSGGASLQGASGMGLLSSSSDSGSSGSPQSGSGSNSEEVGLNSAAAGTDSGGGLDFASYRGSGPDIGSGPGLFDTDLGARLLTKPVAERAVSAASLPSKAKYLPKTKMKSTPQMSSLFKKRGAKGYRRPSLTAVSNPDGSSSDNKEEPGSRLAIAPFMLLLLWGSGVLYKKFALA
ncbi:MAG: hypothetical protein R3A80_04085 [Bdellovibrionota bacterium]